MVGLRKAQKTQSQNKQFLGQRMKPGYPKYKAEVLTILLKH